MNKQTFIKNKVVMAVLLVLIIGLPAIFFVGYYAARASNGSTPVFEHPAITPSYLIWQDGSTFYSKNGLMGEVSSNTNNATLIQSANDALTNGGLIWVTGFEIPSSVSFSSNVVAIQEYNGELTYKSGTLNFFEELSIFHKQDEKSLQTPIIWNPANYNYTIREAEQNTTGYWVGGSGVIYRDGIFWLSYRWRSGNTARGNMTVIANSTDGITFTDVWSANKTDFSHLGTIDSLEVSKLFYDPIQSEFHLFLDLNVAGSWQIYRLDPVSDPANFDASTASVAIAQSGSGWDDGMTKEPTGYYDNGLFVLFYVGRNGTGATSYYDGIGVAYSTDGENFTKYANNPIMNESASNWDSVIIAPYAVIPTIQGVVVYYGGNNDGGTAMDTGLAVWEPDLTTTAQRVSVNSATLSSIKYLDIIIHEGSAYCYYEYPQGDGSSDLVLALVDLTEL